MDQIVALGKQIETVTSADQIKQLFTQLKKSLLKEGIFSITASQLSPDSPNYQTLLTKLQQVLTTYESFATTATKLGAFDLFNQIFTLLSPLYIDFITILPSTTITNSKRLTIIAIKLLTLLTDCSSTSNESLQQFHCQIQYLSLQDRSNELINAVFQLEQFLMQGSYSKLLVSPAITTLSTTIPGISTLTSQLRDIVLTKIAVSLQSSSTTYKIDSLKTIYKLNDDDINVMVTKYNWVNNNGVLIFDNTNQPTTQMDDSTTTTTTINNKDTAIDYNAVQQNKAHTHQLINDLIYIAKQSEKIV